MFVVLLLASGGNVLAQTVRYISDQQYIPVRSGAGNEYRIVHRGLPSGTRLTVTGSTEDGAWSEITTEGGTSGWLRSQYLTREPPAAQKLEAAVKRARTAEDKLAQLQSSIAALQASRGKLESALSSSDAELAGVLAELNQLKQISGKAVQLDADNRRLVEQTEHLRAELETLEAENQRLTDKLRNEDFMNGALAVLLGVIITLVVPRLVPKRRRTSNWA